MEHVEFPTYTSCTHSGLFSSPPLYFELLQFCSFCLFFLDVDISFFFRRLFESLLKLILQFGSYSLFYLENDSFSAFSDVCKKTVQTGLLE